MGLYKAILYFYADDSVKKYFGSYDALSITLRLEVFKMSEGYETSHIRNLRYRLESKYSYFIVEIDSSMSRVTIEPIYMEFTRKCSIELGNTMLTQKFDRKIVEIKNPSRSVSKLWVINAYSRGKTSIVDIRTDRVCLKFCEPCLGVCFFCCCTILLVLLMALVFVTQYVAWY